MSVHLSPRRLSARFQNTYEDESDEDEQHLFHPEDRYDRRRSDSGRPSSPQVQHPRHTQFHASSRMFADPQRAAYDVHTGPFSNAPRPAHTAGEGISGTVYADPAHTCREAALPSSALPSYQSHTRTSGASGRCNTPPSGHYYSDSPYPEPARHDGHLRPGSPQRHPSAAASQPPDAASRAEHQHHPQQRTVTTFDSGGGRGLFSSSSEPIDRVADLEQKSAFYRNADYQLSTSVKPPPLVLKELPIPTFSGDIRTYPVFRNRFIETVGGRSDLEPRHKFQYLLPYLVGEPLHLANGYLITDVNYFKLLDRLEDRYGDKNTLALVLCQAFVEMTPVGQTVRDLRRFHDEALRLSDEMQQVGQNVNNISWRRELLSKIPMPLRVQITETLGKDPMTTPVYEILARISDYVRIREKNELIQAIVRPARNAERSGQQHRTDRSEAKDTSDLSSQQGCDDLESTSTEPAEDEPRVTEAVVTTNADEQLQARRTCPLCGLLHSAADCTVYDTARKRTRRVLKLKLCLLCLREGHPADSCPRRTTHTCTFCRQGQHSRALCLAADDVKQSRTRRPSPVRATRGSNLDPEASDQQRHSRTRAPATTNRRIAELSVNRDDTKLVPTASTLRLSGTQSSRANLPGNLMNRKQRSKDLGTDPYGRTGTNRPPTTSTDESTKQKGADAYGGDRLLSGRHHPLQTDKCSTNREMMQLDRPQCDGSGGAPGSMPDDESPRELYNDEDVPHQPFDSLWTDAVVDWPFNAPDEPWFPTYDESTAYVACASDSDEPPAVLHECLAVTAVNPVSKKSRRAVIMFDSGSSSSHVSSKLADDLDLPLHEMRVQHVSIFGSETPMAVNGFRTFLVLCSVHGRCLQVHVTALDYIVSLVRTALVRDADLLALRRNDCTPTTTREMPDLLIGQDLVHLFDRPLEPTLSSGFYVARPPWARRSEEPADASHHHRRPIQVPVLMPHFKLLRTPTSPKTPRDGRCHHRLRHQTHPLALTAFGYRNSLRIVRPTPPAVPQLVHRKSLRIVRPTPPAILQPQWTIARIVRPTPPAIAQSTTPTSAWRLRRRRRSPRDSLHHCLKCMAFYRGHRRSSFHQIH